MHIMKSALRRCLKLLPQLIIALFLCSCEGFVGDYGYVVDADSGNKLNGVKAELITPNISGISATTDSLGFFNASILVGCVFGGCDEHELIFRKSGYKTLKIDQRYRLNDTIDSDTIFVKLKSIK